MLRERQLIAIGGAGFSIDPASNALAVYLLKQAPTPRPRICFLATASGDAQGYISSFYDAFSNLDCQPSHLTFFERTPDLRSHLLNQDLIYVGGGNTRSMLAVWKEWGADIVLREAWESGVLLAGTSAGAICWFQQGVTDSFAGKLAPLPCLSFVEGSCCPHYDGEPERRPGYHDLLLRGSIRPGYAIDDAAAIHFMGDAMHRVVVARPNARAYGVRVVGGAIEEKAFDAVFLCEQ